MTRPFIGRRSEPVIVDRSQTPLREVLRNAERVERINSVGHAAVAQALNGPTDVHEQYRPKTTVEIVGKVGDMTAESMTVMFGKIAEDVRARAQEVVDNALEAQKAADKFCDDLVRIGEWHASGLKKAAEECVTLLGVLEEQKKLFTKSSAQSAAEPEMKNGSKA